MAVTSKKIVKDKKAPSPKTTKSTGAKTLPPKKVPTKKAVVVPSQKTTAKPKALASSSKPLAKAKPTPAKQALTPKPKKAVLPSLPRAPRVSPLTQIAGNNGYIPNQIPTAVQAVVDKNEIADVVYRVARGLDRIDETLLRSIFHHDATLDLGPGVFQGTSNDYIHWVVGVMHQVRESHHLIGTVMPTLEGDTALVESYCQAHYRMDKPTGREDVFIGSRFLDRFERRPSGLTGVWKIMHRKQVIDWVRTEAVSDLFYHQNPDALWSYRTKTDLSYQMDQFPGSQPGSKLPAFLGRRYESKSVKF
ncbi:MAG: nuclear transport factor 2 family protein [Alphaproteobacteria bacterium]|nr:nuclear transport factor 2 family protein [Alphaproteobacteria bacterium]